MMAPRTDAHGIKDYGPASDLLKEKPDMIEKAIEELLDAIYYMPQGVVRLESQQGRAVALLATRGEGSLVSLSIKKMMLRLNHVLEKTRKYKLQIADIIYYHMFSQAEGSGGVSLG